jgi:hypothetical protein
LRAGEEKRGNQGRYPYPQGGGDRAKARWWGRGADPGTGFTSLKRLPPA